MNLKHTIYCEEWFYSHKLSLMELLPREWTNVRELDILKIGFNLKVLGLDWRNSSDFSEIMVALEEKEVLTRDGDMVKRYALH